MKTAVQNVLLRKKTQDRIIALRRESKVELKDPDLEKFAEEARKLREHVLAKQKADGQPAAGAPVQNSDSQQQSTDTKPPTDIPDLLDEPVDSSGKSDLQIPQQ